VLVEAECVICLSVGSFMYIISYCMCRYNRGLTAKSQQSLRDVVGSKRLLYRRDPENNLATSTICGVGPGTLKRYFRDAKMLPCVIGCFACRRQLKRGKVSE